MWRWRKGRFLCLQVTKKNGLFVALYYKCIYVVWRCHCKWKFLNNKQAMKYFGQQYFVVVAAKCLQIVSFLKKTR